jgi:MFS family permease
MMISARPEMLLRVVGRDPSRAAQLLAGMTTGASLLEFLVTPILGRLSDRVGRRPFLLAAPLICALARAVTFIGASRGSLKSVMLANWIDRCVAGSMFPLCVTLSNPVACRTLHAAADVVTGTSPSAAPQ